MELVIIVLLAMVILMNISDPRNRTIYRCPGCGTARQNEHFDGCHFKERD